MIPVLACFSEEVNTSLWPIHATCAFRQLTSAANVLFELIDQIIKSQQMLFAFVIHILFRIDKEEKAAEFP